MGCAQVALFLRSNKSYLIKKKLKLIRKMAKQNIQDRREQKTNEMTLASRFPYFPWKKLV